MTYQFDQKPNTLFSHQAQEIIQNIVDSEYAVLVGKNNCGKSFLLKTLTQRIGEKAFFLGPARYNNFNILGVSAYNANKTSERWRNFMQQWQQQTQNLDNSPLSLQQSIAELPDTQRQKLIEIIGLLLNTNLEILQTQPENSMSQKYISINGQNISYTSSGLRLITTIVTCLLDTDYDTFLIDEPELGISPEAQGILADFLFHRENRSKYFSHIKRLILATHSTIFLDRLQISNNYSLEKDGDVIDIRQTKTIADFNNIHFFLLGNRLETLFLPTCIILTEGKCDYAFISRALEVKYPGNQFSIINANSDNRMKEIVSLAGNIFTDLQKSPYRTRIIAVLDKVHDSSTKQTLEKAGIPSENIIVWSKNGIEYFYPETIINSIYGAGVELQINSDTVSRNGVQYKKWELCEKIVSRIDDSTLFNSEFETKLFSVINKLLS